MTVYLPVLSTSGLHPPVRVLHLQSLQQRVAYYPPVGDPTMVQSATVVMPFPTPQHKEFPG